MVEEQYRYKVEYDAININHFMSRYHFEKKDGNLVAAAIRIVCELIWITVVIGYEENGVLCAVTLGEKYDRLSDVAEDNLLLAYCMDCVGMELLSKAYENMNEHVHDKTHKWIGGFSFPEDKDAEKTLERLTQHSITWEQGAFHPFKSVVFSASYVSEKIESGCEYCSSCGNLGCAFRKQPEIPYNSEKKYHTKMVETLPYSYGIRHIYKNHD